ncbi:MAG: hypothetical protein ACLR02_14515 [Clostridium sp.]|jgi:hypothetical protein
MYGKITENSIRISKEKIEGYKPIVDEIPLSGKGELDRIEEKEECIARVYLEKEPNNINERLSALEERQIKSEEKQSVTDGAIEELATLMSEVVSNG